MEKRRESPTPFKGSLLGASVPLLLPNPIFGPQWSMLAKQ